MTGFRKNVPLRQEGKQKRFQEQELEKKLFECGEYRKMPVEEEEITQALSRAKTAFYT